jgi:5-formyltetrahydrofolate cyclo-ligase
VTVGETCREDHATAVIQARKRQLRRLILALRRGLPAAERLTRSRLIWDRVARLACYQRADLVLAYMAFDHEVLTDGLIRQAMASGKHIVLPIVQADRQQLALYAVEDFDRDLAPGYRGILEPRPRRARAVAPEALDLALVPGVAFDMWGGRLGFGAGFYDRLLGRLGEVPKLGMAFDFQVIPRLPQQPHDVTLDAVVTDSRVIWGPSPAAGDVTAVARFSNVAGGRGEV